MTLHIAVTAAVISAFMFPLLLALYSTIVYSAAMCDVMHCVLYCDVLCSITMCTVQYSAICIVHYSDTCILYT